MKEEIQQTTDEAQQAEDLLQPMTSGRQMEHDGCHTEVKRRPMLGDGLSTVKNEQQEMKSDREPLVILDPFEALPAGPRMLPSLLFKPLASHHPALETPYTTSQTSDSVQSCDTMHGCPDSEMLASALVSETPTSLGDPELSDPLHVSRTSLESVADLPLECPLQIPAPQDSLSSLKYPSSQIMHSPPASAMSHSFPHIPTLETLYPTPAAANRAHTTTCSPPLTSQQFPNTSSTPLSPGSPARAPTLPLLTQPPAASVQPPFSIEEALLADYQPQERPLSPLIRLLLRGISNRAARPYGRTSPLIVRGGDRRTSPMIVKGGHQDSPFRSAEDVKKMDHQEFPTQTSQSDDTVPLSRPLAAGWAGLETAPGFRLPAPPPPETRDDFKRPRKSKALFVDSAFFSAGDHPTWEEQVKMARRIAVSLSDATNRQSRGQTMYEKRQKRSPRWIHQEEPPVQETDSDSCQGGIPLTSEDYRAPTLTVQTKPILELVTNPQGQLLDLESLRDKGVVINTEGLSPELCSEIIRDLHAANGRGGQIFARRKKRAERWVVDEFHPELSRPGDRPTTKLPQPKPRYVPLYTGISPAETRAETRPETQPETQQHTMSGMNVSIPSVRLEDLWHPSPPARFPTDGVYSPRTPQGWRSPATAPFTAPVFPGSVEPPAAGTVSDITGPTVGTVSDMEPADTWDWSAQEQQQQQQQQQQQRRQPPPAATLFETPRESLKSMEDRRRHGQSNYTPQIWSDHSAH